MDGWDVDCCLIQYRATRLLSRKPKLGVCQWKKLGSYSALKRLKTT